jgi:hypothetical protein
MAIMIRTCAITLFAALFVLTLERKHPVLHSLDPSPVRSCMKLVRHNLIVLNGGSFQMVLRGGGSSSEDTEEESMMNNESNMEDDFDFSFMDKNRTYKASEASLPNQGKRKSRRYANLPDEGTEMAWRLADMIYNRKGEKSKMRSAKSRKAKKLAQTQTLKTLQHGSKRQQQGATARNVSQAVEELMSYEMMLFSGITSGLSTSWIDPKPCAHRVTPALVLRGRGRCRNCKRPSRAAAAPQATSSARI